jgi:hypothetical protein
MVMLAGQIVEGNYQQLGKWYPGEIADVTDGTYSIAYDDGDKEADVGAAFIRCPGEDKKVQWQHTDGRQQENKPEKQALGAIALAGAIKDNGAMTSINVENNNIASEKEEEIYQKVRMNKLSIALSDKSLTALDVSGIGFGAEGAKVVAQYFSDNRALLSLDMRANNLCNREAGKALSQMLTVNTVLTELDVSNNTGRAARDGPGFAKELSSGIRDNGAILKFTFSGDRSGSKPVTIETSMVEADFGGRGLGESGAIMIAAFLPKCM